MPDQLFRLAIPAGWVVRHNRFYDVEMVVSPSDPSWIENNDAFDEDLLHIQAQAWTDSESSTDAFFLDVGWYPSGRPEGAYKLYVGRAPDGYWPDDLPSFQSNNRFHIRAMLEHVMAHPTWWQHDWAISLAHHQRVAGAGGIETLL